MGRLLINLFLTILMLERLLVLLKQNNMCGKMSKNIKIKKLKFKKKEMNKMKIFFKVKISQHIKSMRILHYKIWNIMNKLLVKKWMMKKNI